MYQGCFKGYKGVSKCVPRGYKAILTICPLYFMVVSLVLKGVCGCIKGVARVLHFCFKGDSRVFELFFEEVNSNVVPGCFRDVLVLLLF